MKFEHDAHGIRYKKFSEDPEEFKEENRGLNNIEEGRWMVGVADVMKKRLESLFGTDYGSDEKIAESWWYNQIDTCDAIFIHPSGKFKIVLDAEPMKNFDPEKDVDNYGALVISEEEYNKLEGKEFTWKDLNKFYYRYCDAYHLEDHPVWIALAGGDQKLFEKYAYTFFRKFRETYSSKGDLMYIHLDDVKRDYCTGRLIRINNLYGSSDAKAIYSNLDTNFGTFLTKRKVNPDEKREEISTIIEEEKKNERKN